MKNKIVNILPGGGGSQLSRSSVAFTMAEILLSLTIIGVVAAITLPSLTGNINERTWNTQRKALYARISQAVALMPALNGFGTLDDTTDTAAETFVTAGLAKVLKINNICDNEHLADCGIASLITPMGNGSPIQSEDIKTLALYNTSFTSAKGYNYPDTKAAAFETANGESILVYYNKNCVSNMNETVAHITQSKMCANFVYDLNGNKGPNTVGKDIGFISVLYPSDAIVVAPQPLTQDVAAGNQITAGAKCKAIDDESRMPNIDELAAIYYNQRLLGISYDGDYWSSSVYSSTMAWNHSFLTGQRHLRDRTGTWRIRCVKR